MPLTKLAGLEFTALDVPGSKRTSRLRTGASIERAFSLRRPRLLLPTIFPGYNIFRTTHIHVTNQITLTGNDSSYSDAGVQHLGQLFFDEDLIDSVYQLDTYKAHLSTLDRTTNSEDSLYSTANGDGYSSVVSVSKLGKSLANGLVGYITIGLNHSATPAETTGGSVNVIGALRAVTPTPGAQAAAYALDASEGYFEKKKR